ncbi:hypothetical protein [Schinkia azotoformans]|uniref:hypothetical protein n=1 Tax=Schinkia azotoformans TaxID=1454 RepID=UPI002DBCC7E9|nr:hypothetical protein [Schinkia azotoformans]MEC1786085.1 hypothetical protein [Schinkia azotoformans]MED4420121.1 hypothetical protein [Schinkia azotoformans]
MSELRIPIGFCEITYDSKVLRFFADECEFKAIPKYKKMYSGFDEVGYILEEYDVSLTVPLVEETYETLKMAIYNFDHELNGFYDNPTQVNSEGKPLIIHPIDIGATKEYDIVILNAFIDPEMGFNRVFKKEQDSISIRFKGKSKKINDKLHWFYIGDWSASGVI